MAAYVWIYFKLKYTRYIFDGIFCPVSFVRTDIFCPGLFYLGIFCPSTNNLFVIPILNKVVSVTLKALINQDNMIHDSKLNLCLADPTNQIEINACIIFAYIRFTRAPIFNIICLGLI